MCWFYGSISNPFFSMYLLKYARLFEVELVHFGLSLIKMGGGGGGGMSNVSQCQSISALPFFSNMKQLPLTDSDVGSPQLKLRKYGAENIVVSIINLSLFVQFKL